MGIYLLVFVIGLLYFLLVGGNTKMSKDGRLLAIYFIYLTLFVGLGDMIGGYDRYVYGEAFDSIADVTWGNRTYASAMYLINGVEYGYFIWQVLVSFITMNRYIFILFTTFLIYALLYKSFVKYIDNYPFACIVFLGLMFFFTMTYLRQMIAIGIVLQGIEYIWKRNAVRFFLYVALAATFHTAVLIFGVIYFVPLKKYSKKTITLSLIVCLLIGLTPIPNIIIASAGETTGKVGDYTEQDQGFRIEYVLEVVFFIFIIFKNYSFISEDKKNLTFLNMCYTLCAILFIFMRFGQGGRFAWPFFLGIFYILSKLLCTRRISTINRGFVIIVFFALFSRINNAWAPQQVPYKTFLFNGEPAGDGEIYYKFEYDYSYTYDKFYRPAFTFLK